MADEVDAQAGDTSGGGDTGLNIDSAVSDIASSLGFDSSPDADDNAAAEGHDTDAATTDADADHQPAATDPDADPSAAAEDDAATSAAEVTPRPAPKSWSKDKHELWAKLPPEAQDYYEQREKQMLDGLEAYKEHSAFGKQMKDVTEPYRAFITSQGVDAPKAVQFLLNAHYRLSTAQPADRINYFRNLAQSYGIDPASLVSTEADAAQPDPHVKALEAKVNSLENNLTAREQAALAETKAKLAKDVEAFAADPKHQYFDECSEDIVALINAGHTLEDAYEKAVYANPVTRAKELARLQAENEKTMREKAKKEAEIARKASGTNVRSRDTRQAPTEPKGSMEDTMRATLRSIKERTH